MRTIKELFREREPLTSDPIVPQPFRVVGTRQDTRDTHTLVLEPRDGVPLPFRPGQFTMLHSFGVGEVPISISGDPAHPEILEHTIRNVGAVTASLVAAAPGTILGVRGPFGQGWEVQDGEGGDVVFVAGGLGLAPLRPAILQVAGQRDRYGRVLVLYGSRTPEDILFADDLEAWARDADVRVETTVDNGPPGWTGRVGFVTDLVLRAGFDPVNAFAHICGPEVMMRAVATALRDRGVPGARLRLSMERNMKCGIGLCGHCQLREVFVCVDGPVLDHDRVGPLLGTREL